MYGMTSRPTILDIPFDSADLVSVVQRVGSAIARRTFCHIVTPGPEFLMRARHDRIFRLVLQSAELSLPDGMGVVLAAKALHGKKLTRITGNDLVHGICTEAARQHWRVYLFGSLRPGSVTRAASAVVKKYPGLTIVGAESGFRHGTRISDAIACWRIRRAHADVLFVSFGAPEQDVWIARNKHRLGTVMVAAGIGGAIDYLAGTLPRAPRLVRRLGLEWLVRLALQPRRRWRRIVTAVVEFPCAVVRQKFHV